MCACTYTYSFSLSEKFFSTCFAYWTVSHWGCTILESGKVVKKWVSQGKGGGLRLPLFKGVEWLKSLSPVHIDCCPRGSAVFPPHPLATNSCPLEHCTCLCSFVVKHSRKLIMYLQKETRGVNFSQIHSLIIFINSYAGTSKASRTCSWVEG